MPKPIRREFDREKMEWQVFVGVAGLLLALLTFLCSSIAHGAGSTANLTWTVPTAYSDGTAIGANDIAFYTISYTQAGTARTLKVTAPASSTTIPVACGGTAFSITVTTGASAVYPNATSSPDGPVPYASGVNCVPNAPTNLTAS